MYVVLYNTTTRSRNCVDLIAKRLSSNPSLTTRTCTRTLPSKVLSKVLSYFRTKVLSYKVLSYFRTKVRSIDCTVVVVVLSKILPEV